MSSIPASPASPDVYLGARPARENLATEVKSALASAEAMLAEAAGATEHEARVLREKAAEVLARAGNALHGAADSAVANAKVAAHRTDVWVHENPWKAIGIAAGVGLAVGLLINRR